MQITDVELIRFTYTSRQVRDAEGHGHPGLAHEEIGSIVHIATDEGVSGYAVGGVLRSMGCAGGTVASTRALSSRLRYGHQSCL